MATTLISLQGGYFKGVANATHVTTINGWNCTILTDGTIFCEVSREYSDGLHSMRYVIRPNGFAKLTLKVPHCQVETLRKGYVIPKGAKLSDGVIGLAGGNVDDRYAYFRDETFQRFLERFGIHAVKHENPNQKFTSCWSRGGFGGITVYTDGVSHHDFEESCFSESWRNSEDISKASWAIVETHGATGGVHRLLYTEKNPLDLESSLLSNPKVRLDALKRQQSYKLHQLNGLEVHNLENIQQVVATALAIAPNFKNLIVKEEVEKFFDIWPASTERKFVVEAIGYHKSENFEVRICREGGYVPCLKVAAGALG